MMLTFLLIVGLIVVAGLAIWIWRIDAHIGHRPKRVDFQVPVRLHLGNAFIETTSIDLSQGGMCLEIAAPASVGQPAEVEFAGADAATVSLHAVVRWSAKQKMGVQFDVMDPRREMVSAWLSRGSGALSEN